MSHKTKLTALIGALLLGCGVIWGIWAGPLPTLRAQDSGTAEQAIALAAAHPAFADYLANTEGWQAGAYFTGSRFHIWRVDFWTRDEEPIGWASVSLETGLVYSHEVYYRLSEAQIKQGEAAVQAFVRENRDVRRLLGRINEYDAYIDYRADQRLWVVYLYQDDSGVGVVVRFNDASPLSFNEPELVQIMFPEVLSYHEWRQNSSARAVALAFTQPELAAGVRDHAGWKGTAVLDNARGLWVVSFTVDGREIAVAAVNLETGQVVEYALR